MNLTPLDRIEATDLRAEVSRRIEAADPLRPVPEPPRLERRVGAALLALIVFAVASAFVVRAFRMQPEPEPPAPVVPASWASYGEGWSELPPPPGWRDGATLVWTGERLLYLGGSDRGIDDPQPLADGWSLDPATGTWSSVPAAPEAFWWGHAVWTGTEVLVYAADGTDRAALPPMAFDPDTGRWRAFPRSPHTPSFGGAWAWTGDELFHIGGGPPGDPTTVSGAALEPASSSWRRLPDAPAPVNLANATWTGRDVVVVGSAVDGANHAATRTSIAMAYSPTDDRWVQLPDPPVSSQTADIDHVDGRLIAWELYSPAAAEYLRGSGAWRSIETGAVSGGECYAEGTVIGSLLFSWNCGRPGVFLPATSFFAPLEAPPISDPDIGGYASGVAVAAGDVVVVERIEATSDGNGVVLDAPDAPVSLLAWRPPDDPVAVSSWSPTGADAENLVGEFMADWAPGWEVYLPTLATAGVIERAGSGDEGLVPLDGWTVRTWNSFMGDEIEPGVFEVRIQPIRDGQVIATLWFTVGPGMTADGREGPLVIFDVRPG